MARTLAACLTFALAATAAAQDDAPPARFGLEADFDNYPQATAKEALGSVLRAMERGKVEYLLAHLADPAFADARVKFHGGKFDAAVREVRTKLDEDPAARRELGRFLREGQWQEEQTTAVVRLKDIPARQVVLKKQGTRWYLENAARAAPPKKDE